MYMLIYVYIYHDIIRQNCQSYSNTKQNVSYLAYNFKDTKKEKKTYI